MAAKLILPDVAGEYVTDTLTDTSQADSNTFVFLPNCDGFTVVVEHVTGTPAGDVQLMNRPAFVGTAQAFAGPISVATSGDPTRFTRNDGPFGGEWYVDGTGITSGSVKIHVVAAQGPL